MGCKCIDNKSADGAQKRSTNPKIRKGKFSRCVCAQRFDTSFPYKDLPPPAPPDGRVDLWELQFCRWWGWNWVRKHEPATTKWEDQTYLTGKNIDYSADEIPTKDKEEPKRETCKTKKAYFSTKEPETTQCPQIPLTTKDQFKAICKCLLGKKNMPSIMAKLYNTPSNSVVAFKRQERESYGTVEKCIQPTCDKKAAKACKKKMRLEQENTRLSKAKSGKRLGLTSTSTSAQFTVGGSSCSQGPGSTTEESTEYLTFRVHHKKGDGCDCSCTVPAQVKAKVQQVDVSTDEMKEAVKEPAIIISKDTKETQTCFVTEEKCTGPFEHKCSYTEKCVKVKGKKQKTICIMVCCCGSCKEDNSHSKKNLLTEDSIMNKKDGQVNKLLQDNNCTRLNDQYKMNEKKDNDTSKMWQDNDRFEAIDTLTALPTYLLSPFSNKKISKFGTPSKNYPWMQTTESSGTTTSLNNIDNWTSVSNDLYDLLNPVIATNNNIQDPIGFNDRLSYLKQIDTSNKTDEENRILLDAICDAILKEHDDKTGQLLDEFKFETKDDMNVNYRDLGIVCHLKNEQNDKVDAYTELVNSEDIDVHQLTKISKLSGIQEHSDNRNLDVMGILDNIFHNSKDIISKNENNNSNHNFQFTGTDLASSPRPYRTAKRCATVLGNDEKWGSKKIKQENEISLSVEPPNVRIKHIFSKIEDIVNKSKEKTIEIQKVLNYIPKKHAHNEQTENILHIQDLNQNSAENVAASDAAKPISKRIYPISSDTFKKMYCECKNVQIVNFGNTNCDSEPKSTLEGHDQTEPKICVDTCVKGIICQEQQNKNDNNENILKPPISKLCIQNFVVCDEQSKVEPKLSSSSISRLFGKKLMRNISSRGSLIPVRRRSNTNC